MRFRQGNPEDFLRLDWAWPRAHSRTQRLFTERMEAGTQELWVCERGACLVGELHIVWQADDPEEADGSKRAYLCAFRVQPEHQGNGIGGGLMRRALVRIREKGFREATIGVEEREPGLQNVYASWGFSTWIKTCSIDPHCLDDWGLPRASAPYRLLLQTLPEIEEEEQDPDEAVSSPPSARKKGEQ
ncbi:hypothetical protein J31TS4_10440 [Paenibacillus sp. J31TS4]|nr:hypothetical protein J31TS4_10440 [Paenibacillus sp. J31TS4]